MEWKSQWVKTKKGVRQKCVFSPDSPPYVNKQTCIEDLEDLECQKIRERETRNLESRQRYCSQGRFTS